MPPRRTDDRLARKGRDVPLPALLEQARASLQLARAHADELARFGWPALRSDALGAQIDAVTAAARDRQAHAAALEAAVRSEALARREAMRFLRHLRTALPMVLRDAAVGRAEFFAGGPLGRSSAKVEAHLAAIGAPLDWIDDALAPYFPALRASIWRTRAQGDLAAARARRAQIEGEIPARTDAIHRAAGALLEGIEDLHRVARLAFDGEPLLRAAFSKRWIERGRRRAA